VADFDFSAALTATLRTYANGVAEAVDEAAEKCAKGLAKELRGTAPKRTGAYAKDWTSKQTARRRTPCTTKPITSLHTFCRMATKALPPHRPTRTLTARRKSGSKNSLPSARKRPNEKKHHTCPAC